tara:strand:+ start:1810 stop:2160 length:351 start_codon:yes stop_codon:yes gene_type:complete
MSESVRDFLLRGEREENFSLADVVQHGCIGGTISELIYYSDTVKFYDEQEDTIWQRLNDEAEQHGYNVIQYIAQFHNIKSVCSDIGFKNHLAWWICEMVANDIIEERENEKDEAKA